jgi:tartrate dehydrogenase/decarboxylase/D-malate dehydrogenase
MPYWDERVTAMAQSYSDVKWDKYHIDILIAHFVLHPDWFDVVVAPISLEIFFPISALLA